MDIDITRNRTAEQWLAIADEWHWKAVELHCDMDDDQRRRAQGDIRSFQAFADYALQRALIAPATALDDHRTA
ncbi:hypothetical protein [Streptomyces ipomoeae]|uniref:hypothetical protein n=1 Tax=Streptomyces ipomoeae TaxID=103232 RepID=UPI0029B8D797|nr:hypothetical protein [Streptomyces ipomoeae]MDX2698935.1 hypothetical protein [Streptomyces ipomoeae]MDX2844577.1 hypothetical protein [Streptomyces ipomoeae]